MTRGADTGKLRQLGIRLGREATRGAERRTDTGANTRVNREIRQSYQLKRCTRVTTRRQFTGEVALVLGKLSRLKKYREKLEVLR